MNFELNINKKDVITIILVSVVFFGIAAWNVGSIQYPVTNWQSTQPESFYVNLGGMQNVQTVYFWVESGNASVTIYSGSPENWTSVGNLILQPLGTDYSVFEPCTVNANTQFLSFDVSQQIMILDLISIGVFPTLRISCRHRSFKSLKLVCKARITSKFGS